MTDPHSPDAPPPEDNLPPVTPPSAGFILQLFVVPALIVLAVVVAWTLFGRMASGEQDWRILVQEMESSNPHVYRRAMFGMAQLLDVDRRRGDEGQHLARQPEVAQALTTLLKKQLQSPEQDEETLSAQVYLTRALGLVDVNELTFPVLNQALDDRFDSEVRKGAVTSIAMIAGRTPQRGGHLSSEEVPELFELSNDQSPALRRAAAFALGLFPDDEAHQRLLVLLEDADFMTEMNAAIGLARSNSTAGFPILLKGLQLPADQTSEEARLERQLILRNGLRAISQLAPKFTDREREQLVEELDRLSRKDAEVRLRVDAQQALSALQAVEST